MSTLSIPSGPSALDGPWLTDCLRRAGALPFGHVTGVRLERIAEGVAMLGQLVRVHLRYDEVVPGAPKTLVVKFASANPAPVAFGEALGFYMREHQFYTRSASATPLHTPIAYYSGLEGKSKLVLVLEDIPGVVGNQMHGATPQQTMLAARKVAEHHARFWNRARSGSQDWIPPLSDPAIVSMLQAVTRQGAVRLLAELPECFDREDRVVTELLAPKMSALVASMGATNTTWVHGDYRLENLLFGRAGEPELTVLDWQICYVTCAPYDVAYFVTESVEPEVRRRIEPELLRTYHRALLAHGVTAYSVEDCYLDYRKAATFCLCYPLIVAGTFDLSTQRGRTLGTMLLNRALSATRDVDSLGLLEGLS